MHESESAARPLRRHPVHQPVFMSGNRAVIIFLTVCTKNRIPVLANSVMHASIVRAWIAADHWLVGRYTILPDHIHLFCAPNTCPMESLTLWVKYWKGMIAKTTGAGAHSLWEKDFWDVQLRRGDSYAAKWEYVRNNPVRHGLVARAEDWPYQGELNSLRWHD
jgi:putative transposase